MIKRLFQYFMCFIFIVLMIFAIVAIINYKKPNEVIIKSNALIYENTVDYTNEIKVYLEPYTTEGQYLICHGEKNECGKEYLTIKTVTKDAYLLENYKYKYFFYIDDEKVKVFDASEAKSYIIDNLDSNYSTDFIVDNNDNFIGVAFTRDLNQRMSFLLLYSNEVLYNNKYDYITSVSPKYLTANSYDDEGNQIGSYIINAYKEEEPLIKKEYISSEYYSFYDLGKKYITFENGRELEIYDNNTLKLIYKTNKSSVMDGQGYPRFLLNVDEEDNIYVYVDRYLSILDGNGKTIKKSNKEIKGIDLVDKYIISTDNEELTITDIDNNVIKIASLKNGKLDYYDFINNNYKKGLIFDVYDRTVSYDSVYNECKKDSCKELTFDDFKKEYNNCLGYQYFYDYNTSKIIKTPSIIVSTDEID